MSRQFFARSSNLQVLFQRLEITRRSRPTCAMRTSISPSEPRYLRTNGAQRRPLFSPPVRAISICVDAPISAKVPIHLRQRGIVRPFAKRCLRRPHLGPAMMTLSAAVAAHLTVAGTFWWGTALQRLCPPYAIITPYYSPSPYPPRHKPRAPMSMNFFDMSAIPCSLVTFPVAPAALHASLSFNVAA